MFLAENGSGCMELSDFVCIFAKGKQKQHGEIFRWSCGMPSKFSHTRN